MTLDHFDRGINLGGWLSQYQRIDERHFESFITEGDVEQIAGWGMDHVRLPVDYPVLEDDAQPFTYRAEGLGYIDRCLAWCQKRGLGLVLDLHKAPGYSFTETLESGDASRNTLFTDEDTQQRFIRLWEMLARRYRHAREGLAFELLNEIVLPDSEPWNRLARRTIEAIRAIDAERTIIIGGNYYNSASQLQYLTLVDDPNVQYTFHFYEPMLFTHQKAHWVAAAVRYNRDVRYPGPLPGLEEFLAEYPEFTGFLGWQVGRTMDRAMLEELLQPAVEFQARTGKKLYCGEFGVIEHVDADCQANWLRDFTGLLREHGMGWALWSYKQMDFGLVGADGKLVEPRLLEALSG